VGVKPVFHLRIFSREANFSFVFIQLVPVERSKTNEKFASREKIRKWKTGLTTCAFLRVQNHSSHMRLNRGYDRTTTHAKISHL
jgi:hypothetical protein